MAIVTYAFYVQQYLGEPVAEDDFPRMEAKAERLINQLTHGRSSLFGDLPVFQQDAVKDAICAQIEYYSLMGTEISINGDTTGGNGWTVGKVHINSRANNAQAKSAAESMLCSAAIAALEQTGLMNPQVPTIDKPPYYGLGVV